MSPRRLTRAVNGALAALLLMASSGSAVAVKASPPTVTCTQKCQICVEMEHAPGGDRCVKCGLDPNCNASNMNLSPEAREFLDAHNAQRSKHCTPELRWSEKLAADALAWAKTCNYKHSDVGGESLSASWGTATRTPQAVVDAWYGEIKDYDFNNPKCCNPPDSPKVGHFTQVVWQNTTEVGCASVMCPPPPPGDASWTGQWQYAVCRYAPPGNFNVDKPGELAANVPNVAPKACVRPQATCVNACHSPSARPEIKTPIDLGGIFVQPSAVHGGCRGGMMMTALGRCACPEGSSWQSRLCAPSAAAIIEAVPESAVKPSSVVPAQDRVQPSGEVKVRPTCPASRPVGVPPNCCPLDTVFSGGACVRVGPMPQAEIDKVQIRACPPERPVGTPPNCCPADTSFNGTACVRAVPPAPRTGGTAGSDKVQAQTCPADRPVGSWPNCCPAGTSFANGACLRKAQTQFPQQQPQQQPSVCPPDRPVGSYPNCCPAGTAYTNGACAGGGISTSREPPARDSTTGKVIPAPKPMDVNKSDIFTRPSGNLGDVLKKTCPKGQELNAMGQCEEVFRAPR